MVSKSGCLGWFKKRTNMEKTLLSMSSLLLLTLLLMILFGVAYHSKASDMMSDQDRFCFTEGCIESAGRVLSAMDSKVDPCSNFYDFSCGRYGRELEQTSSASKHSRDALYYALKNLMESTEKMNIDGYEDVKRFYGSCVRFGTYRQDVDETKESFLNLMSEFGLGIWPIIDPLYDIENFALEQTLAGLILLDVPVVFDMEVIPDELTQETYLIKISPGGPRESGRSPTDIRDDVQLRSSVLTSLLLLGASAANTDVNDILAVDSSFAAIEQDEETICDKTLLAPEEVVPEMNRFIPEINWDIIMTEIRNATGLLRPFAVELHCKQRIRDYVVHLNDLSLRSETNYLGWRFFSKFVEHVIPTFEKSQFGEEEAIPRWRICLELLEKYSSTLLAEAITKKYIPKETQQQIEKISKAVLGATQRLVSQSRWLPETQKSKLREKVTRIRMRYPFKRTDDTMPVRMPEVHVSNFTAVTMRQQKQWVIKKFKKLLMSGVSSEATESWISLVSPTDAADLSENAISVYFNKIQEPYYRLHGSQWASYAGYGVFVARDVARIILNMHTSSSKTEDSEILNLWRDYKNTTLCLKSYASQLGMDYESMTPRFIPKMLQVIFMDHSSIEIAYEAAKSTASASTSLPGLDFSDQEMFFLSYVQTLCDGRAISGAPESILVKNRVNSAVVNLKAFNDVYSCTRPSSRCEIWT